MSTEQNKAQARRVFEEIWTKGTLAAIDELIAPDAVNHFMPPGMPAGREGFRQYVMMYRSAFPDAQFAIEDMVAEGEKVVTRWTATATQTGPLPGIPATGKKAVVSGITITRYDASGKSVEDWSTFDQLGMLQQLGVVPMPG